MLGRGEKKRDMTNRGRIEIIANILAFCRQPRLKTQIMYNTNITFRQFETYFNLLSSQGLLAQKSRQYVTTMRGHRFVDAFNQLESTLEGFPVGGFARSAVLKTRQQKTPIGAIEKSDTVYVQR